MAESNAAVFCSQPLSGLGSFGRLPAELRVRIYEILLDPEKSRPVPASLSRTSIGWNGYTKACERYIKNYAHRVGGGACECSSGGAFISFTRQESEIFVQILCVSRKMSEEALPYLYKSRVFVPRNFRTFGSGFGALVERWWILCNFLSKLSSSARQSVKTVRLPMMLETLADFECGNAFVAVRRLAPKLQNVELELIGGQSLIDSVKEYQDRSCGPSDSNQKRWKHQVTFDLRPALVFVDLHVAIDVIASNTKQIVIGTITNTDLSTARSFVEAEWKKLAAKSNRKELMSQVGIDDNQLFRDDK